MADLVSDGSYSIIIYSDYVITQVSQAVELK